MLIRAVLFATAVAVSSGIAPVLAQQPHRVTITTAAGLAKTVGTFHSGYRQEGFKSAIAMMVAVSLPVPHLPIPLRLDATYSGHGATDQLKTSLQSALGQAADEHVSVLGGNVDLLLVAPSGKKVKPYALAGIGAYRTSFSLKTAGSGGPTAVVKPAWNAGVGLSIRGGGAGFSIEARLLSVAGPTGLPRVTMVPIQLGVQFGPR